MVLQFVKNYSWVVVTVVLFIGFIISIYLAFKKAPLSSGNERSIGKNPPSVNNVIAWLIVIFGFSFAISSLITLIKCIFKL